MTDVMPDVQLIFNGQCFPRWRYLEPVDVSGTIRTIELLNISGGGRIVLIIFQTLCCVLSVSITAIKPSPKTTSSITSTGSYTHRVTENSSLTICPRCIPRIPYAPDFRAFAEAGKALADLHLNYETCEQCPDLRVEPITPSLLWEEKPEHFLLGKRAMRFADKQERTTLIINEHVCVSGIPEEAHRYVVNGRTPLEWFIDRYKITQDKNSGIVNDPNGWFENPRDLITAIERIVYVSVESTKIIEALPG